MKGKVNSKKNWVERWLTPSKGTLNLVASCLVSRACSRVLRMRKPDTYSFATFVLHVLSHGLALVADCNFPSWNVHDPVITFPGSPPELSCLHVSPLPGGPCKDSQLLLIVQSPKPSFEICMTDLFSSHDVLSSDFPTVSFPAKVLSFPNLSA